MCALNTKLKLFELCSSVITDAISTEDAMSKLRETFMDEKSSLPNELFNVLVDFLGLPFYGKKQERADKFFKAVFDELKLDVLKKPNVVYDETGAYAKILAELLTYNPEADPKSVFYYFKSLINKFGLDMSRVISLLLDAFSNNFRSYRMFISLIRLFKIETNALKKSVLLKFILFKKSGHTPNAFYRVVAVLISLDMLNFMEIFQTLSPTDEQFVKDLEEQQKVLVSRISKSQTISTQAVTEIEESRSSKNENRHPLSSILEAQELEDRKASGGSFDENLILSTNQKLGLLVAAAEIGSLKLVQVMVPLFPESYPLGTSKRFAKSLCRILEYIIDPFYSLKCQLNHTDKLDTIKDWGNLLIEYLEQLSKWEEFSVHVLPLLQILGPYLGVNRDVAIKLVRLLNVFFAEEETNPEESCEKSTNLIYSIVDFCLLPSMSIGSTSFAYVKEVWKIMSRLPYQNRYQMYGRWKTIHPIDNYKLQLQGGKIIGQMKYVMKRLSKETIKIVGKQLEEICLKHPTVAFDFMLERVQNFQNLIGPLVESMHYFSEFTMDVLTYSLIEALSQPSKESLKTSDGTLSGWIFSLSSFCGAIYRRYSLEYEGVLQYVANQLKLGKSVDLIILREVITVTAGFKPTNSLTDDQLDALCNGKVLRQEVIENASQKGGHQAISRLCDTLLRTDLCQSLAILLAQQKNFIVYNEAKDAPVKLISQMVDQCQDTFMQFSTFIRFNIKSEEYFNRIPNITSLFQDYRLSPESAFFLARPNYSNKSLKIYEELKKAQATQKEGAENNKLDSKEKEELHVKSLIQVVNSVEEEVRLCMPDRFSIALTSKVYTFFWLFSISDIQVSTALYNREIEKVRKELADLPKANIPKNRLPKEEARLKALEEKLKQELSLQEKQVFRVKILLKKFKDEFFTGDSTASTVHLKVFIQFCLLPRCVFSEVDAIYCSKFINILHSIKADNFFTLLLFDEIFAHTIPILSALSENEASAFGKFLSLILETLLKWHSKGKIYKEECQEFPGSMADANDPKSALPFVGFRKTCFKWQLRLKESFKKALSEKSNHSLVRNAFLVMNKILTQFPLIDVHSSELEDAVKLVRDREKDNRMDLSVMAQSYLVHLKKRSVKIYKTEDFNSSVIKKKISSRLTSSK